MSSTAKPTAKPTARKAFNIQGLPEEHAQFLCKVIRDDSGMDLDESRAYLLQARLMPIIKSQNLGGLDRLCAALRSPGGKVLRKKIVEAMTNSETLFFRDLTLFEGLRKVLIPRLTGDHKRGGRISFLSAGCSSGQEAYSLAMVVLEMGLQSGDCEIVGMDISERSLERARAGRYSQLEVNRGLPGKYLAKYFTAADVDWVLKPEVGQMVKWIKGNLTEGLWSLGRYHVVLCRNVLTDFDKATKKFVLEKIRRILVPGGYLVLGSSENVASMEDCFTEVKIGPATMYQVPGK